VLLILFFVAKYDVQNIFFKNREGRRIDEFLHVRQRFGNVGKFFFYNYEDVLHWKRRLSSSTSLKNFLF